MQVHQRTAEVLVLCDRPWHTRSALFFVLVLVLTTANLVYLGMYQEERHKAVALMGFALACLFGGAAYAIRNCYNLIWTFDKTTNTAVNLKIKPSFVKIFDGNFHLLELRSSPVI